MAPDRDTHQDNGPGTDVAVRSDDGRQSPSRKDPFAECPVHRRVRVNLRAGCYVASGADRQSARPVDDRECPDPCAFANFGLTDEPRVSVVRIGRQMVPRRVLLHGR